ncbi:bone sialoprotein 2 [Mastomys coucha]|uniref:bone sialoprotein 2 n=1 Tax=Mastomys coucha TaxID=35658 RepID=UPI0012623BC9|nr:bone sialoprotein 2 [Mastomys coucha]
MKTALILLSILGMACAFSMKNFHRRIKAEDSEENGVYKYRPRYFLYKHAYFYPPLKRFPVQGGSDSSEENGDGDSSEEEGEEEETSNEEENNEDSEGNEEEEAEAEAEAEAENATLSTFSGVTSSYGAETTAEAGAFELAALQLPKKAGDAEGKAPKTKESDEEEEEEEEENENEEAEVDENEQMINGTSTNSTEVDGGNGSSGGDNGEEEAEEASVTEAGAEGTTPGREPTSVGTQTAVLLNGFQQTTPPPEAYGATLPPIRKSSTVEYGGEYEQTGNEYNNEYEVYDNENGEPRGDTYRAYEDEYSYYKGHGYGGYEGQNYYYHQ